MEEPSDDTPPRFVLWGFSLLMLAMVVFGMPFFACPLGGLIALAVGPAVFVYGCVTVARRKVWLTPKRIIEGGKAIALGVFLILLGIGFLAFVVFVFASMPEGN